MKAVEAKRRARSARKCKRRDKRENADGGRGGGEGFPTVGGNQHQRNQQSELRLIGEQAKWDSRKERARIEQQQSESHQRRGEESVVTVSEVDEDRGISDGGKDRQSAVFTTDDGADGQQIERQRRALARGRARADKAAMPAAATERKKGG